MTQEQNRVGDARRAVPIYVAAPKPLAGGWGEVDPSVARDPLLARGELEVARADRDLVGDSLKSGKLPEPHCLGILSTCPLSIRGGSRRMRSAAAKLEARLRPFGPQARRKAGFKPPRAARRGLPFSRVFRRGINRRGRRGTLRNDLRSVFLGRGGRR
jgi:hypothetical protein